MDTGHNFFGSMFNAGQSLENPQAICAQLEDIHAQRSVLLSQLQHLQKREEQLHLAVRQCVSSSQPSVLPPFFANALPFMTGPGPLDDLNRIFADVHAADPEETVKTEAEVPWQAFELSNSQSRLSQNGTPSALPGGSGTNERFILWHHTGRIF